MTNSHRTPHSRHSPHAGIGVGRQKITAGVDGVQDLIDLANGKMPEQWDRSLNLDANGKRTGSQVKLTLKDMIEANSVVLKFVLPELKRVSVSAEDVAGEPITFEQARAIMADAIKSIIVSNGGTIDPQTGEITVPKDFKKIEIPDEVEETDEEDEDD